MMDVITRNFKPADSIGDADITLTTRALLKRFDSIVAIAPEDEKSLLLLMDDAGYKLGVVAGSGDMHLYWMFKNKAI